MCPPLCQGFRYVFCQIPLQLPTVQSMFAAHGVSLQTRDKISGKICYLLQECKTTQHQQVFSFGLREARNALARAVKACDNEKELETHIYRVILVEYAMGHNEKQVKLFTALVTRVFHTSDMAEHPALLQLDADNFDTNFANYLHVCYETENKIMT